MKKIGWFRRLFMSWDQFESHFNVDKYQELNKAKDKTIESLNARLNDLISEKTKYENESKTYKAQLDSEKNMHHEYQRKVITLESELKSKKEETAHIKNEIRDQLSTIGKIEKTFFASTGNKGKGELGEQQVKVILEKSGLSKDMWVQNLTVNNGTVEFAMQSGEEGKYIPIDSKVLEPNFDEDGKPIIDEGYKRKVQTQVKEITKYLGKSNTADYGIIVLQSDSIYMKLFDEFPTFFEEMIREYKVYINSPSSFVQTAWSISHLIEIYKRVHNDEKIYNDMIDALTSVSKFATSLSKVHKDFNIAMETHYPTIEKRHSGLVKRLTKEGKINDIPKIGNKEEK